MEERSLKTLEINDSKAGMEGLDKRRIDAIIQSASKGSKFYAHKLKAQERIDAKAGNLQAALNKIKEDELQTAIEVVDSIARRLELSRDLQKTIVHIDMDAFYAAIEMRDCPSLKSVPMAVGSSSMLCTSNYLARKYGVRAAMPGFIAKKLCPELIIIEPNMEKYAAVSQEIHGVFEEFDPSFCGISLDEAYLDISKYIAENYGDFCDNESAANEVVECIREKVFHKTQLTSSAGIGPNTLLAKICSDVCKPNGQFYLQKDVQVIRQFVAQLPIRKVPGIGNVSEQLLKSLNIMHCGQLWDRRAILYLLFSKCQFEGFLDISMGLGTTDLSNWGEQPRKSMSVERTFTPCNSSEQLISICKDLVEELGEDMKIKGIIGRTLTLKIKGDDFQVHTRAQRLLTYTNSSEVMLETASKLLLQEVRRGIIVRLLGVRMSTLLAKVKLQQPNISDLLKKVANHKTHIGEERNNMLGGESSATNVNVYGSQMNNTDCKQWGETDDKISSDLPCSHNTADNVASLDPQVSNMADDLMESGCVLPLSDSMDSNCGIDETFSKNTPNVDGVAPGCASCNSKSFEIVNSSLGPTQCPVCFELLPPMSIQLMNQHLDLCLNKKVINEMQLASVRTPNAKKLTEKKKITHFFHPT